MSADQINGYIKNQSKEENIALQTLLLKQSLYEVQSRAATLRFQDIFLFACLGSLAGGTITYYFKNSVKVAALGALVGSLACNVGQYTCKKISPDTIGHLDFDDVIGTVAAFLDKKENNFPIVDLHIPNGSNGFHEKNLVEKQRISLYQSVMDRKIVTSLACNQIRLQAWMQIRQLCEDHHQQQISKLPSHGWLKYIST